MRSRTLLSALLSFGLLAGCNSSEPTAPVANTTAPSESSDAVTATPPTQTEPAVDAGEPARPVRRGPVSLGARPGDSLATPAKKSVTGADLDTETAFEALKPLQILMGSWEGKTRRTFNGFAAVDEPQWVWDFLSDRKRPALKMVSEDSPYFETMRVTYDPKEQKYLLTSVHKDYGERVLEGEFTEEIKDVPGDDDKLHRTYKLEFTQVAPADANEQWQILFNQQDNNRYLVEMSKKRGQAQFARFDTVASQRQGTSFALSDSDYGEKACIVSGGLGTMTVSFQGKTYYVCCSGCDAAFKEEPERWIAKALGESEMEKKP